MATSPPGLIAYSLEIGKALAERDRAILHAKGMCMYPLVRTGDLLHIQSRRVEQVNIGDIAVCRRSGRLVCHRTIGKGVLAGRPYIVTRSDRNKQVSDPFTYDEDLLGVVTCIERKGRFTDPYTDPQKGQDRAFLALRRLVADLYGACRGRIIAVLPAVRQNPIYRYTSRFLKASSRRPGRFEVRVWKESWRKLNLYMPLKPEEFDINRPVFPGIPLNRWTLTLHFGPQREPAARATLQYTENKWSLDDLLVRPRYRGMGLEKDLLLKAEEIFSRSGITDIDLNRFHLE
ncbi:MAG: S24/S26 family peptidase [Acidobacteria bacterium]|nr:S24/S26 family peptidase [Acidobacteriota bacterium]